jgi:hypothetical protein
VRRVVNFFQGSEDHGEPSTALEQEALRQYIGRLVIDGTTQQHRSEMAASPKVSNELDALRAELEICKLELLEAKRRNGVLVEERCADGIDDLPHKL